MFCRLWKNRNWKITFWNLRETLHLGSDYRHLVAVYPKWKCQDKGQSPVYLGVAFKNPQAWVMRSR